MSLIKKIREAVHVDSVGRRKDGCVVVRRGFFYRHGGSAELFAEKVTTALEKNNINAHVIDSGEVWKAFSGGATVANRRYWFVVLEEKVATA